METVENDPESDGSEEDHEQQRRDDGELDRRRTALVPDPCWLQAVVPLDSVRKPGLSPPERPWRFVTLNTTLVTDARLFSLCMGRQSCLET